LIVLTFTKSLSDSLQSTQIDLSKAANLVAATESTLQDFRTDDEWEKVFTYAKSVAEANSIDINNQVQSQRQRRTPRHFDDGIVYQSIGARDTLSTSQHCKVAIYFPVLDSVLLEIRDRFSHNNVKLMKAISSTNPQSNTFLDATSLKPLAIGYNLDYDCLSMEEIAFMCLTLL